MRRNDYLLCLAIALLAAYSYWYFVANRPASAYIRITKHNELILEQPLADFPNAYTLTTEHGSMQLKKTTAGLAVTAAPCPDKLCVKKGTISRGSIVCVPEGVIIELISDQEGAPDALLH